MSFGFFFFLAHVPFCFIYCNQPPGGDLNVLATLSGLFSNCRVSRPIPCHGIFFFLRVYLVEIWSGLILIGYWASLVAQTWQPFLCGAFGSRIDLCWIPDIYFSVLFFLGDLTDIVDEVHKRDSHHPFSFGHWSQKS